jgi:hypothetical protein
MYNNMSYIYIEGKLKAKTLYKAQNLGFTVFLNSLK